MDRFCLQHSKIAKTRFRVDIGNIAQTEKGQVKYDMTVRAARTGDMNNVTDG